MGIKKRHLFQDRSRGHDAATGQRVKKYQKQEEDSLLGSQRDYGLAGDLISYFYPLIFWDNKCLFWVGQGLLTCVRDSRLNSSRDAKSLSLGDLKKSFSFMLWLLCSQIGSTNEGSFMLPSVTQNLQQNTSKPNSDRACWKGQMLGLKGIYLRFTRTVQHMQINEFLGHINRMKGWTKWQNGPRDIALWKNTCPV